MGKRLHARLKEIHNRATKGEGGLDEDSSSFTQEYLAYKLEKEIGEIAERFLELEDEDTNNIAETGIKTSGSQTKDLRWTPVLVGSEKPCYPDERTGHLPVRREMRVL